LTRTTSSALFVGRTVVRPNVRAPGAAGLANELLFDVGQPNPIWPSVGVDRGRVAAFVVRAIDQDAADAHLAHFAEGDFLGALHGRH
jgi:hypothetical protein